MDLQGAPGAPAAAPAAPPKEEKKPEANDAEDDSKFDHFMGNDAGALAGTFGEYYQDDREADEARSAPSSRQLRHSVQGNSLSMLLACLRLMLLTHLRQWSAVLQAAHRLPHLNAAPGCLAPHAQSEISTILAQRLRDSPFAL